MTRAAVEEAGVKMKGAVKKHPVSEIFGPTIQGEGEHQGIPAYFVRFGGCDYRCEWCDTPHAVLPEQVRHSNRMTSDEIIDALSALAPGPQWVVLTGGNPALHDLSALVTGLQGAGRLVSVETQGTRWKPWLREVDSLCISPKPPSSGMPVKKTEEALDKFMAQVDENYFLKVVVFDHADYEWARMIHQRHFYASFFVSAGNDAGKTVGRPDRVDQRTRAQVVTDLLERTKWLTNRVMVDPEMCDVRVQSQQHVLLWGNEIGH